MLVKVIGNGITWTKRPNTNFIINNEILFDTPQSSTKFMNGIIDYEKLKIIIISHFHSDHFAELYIIFDYLRRRKNKEKVTIIAPRSFLKRFKKILKWLELKKNIVYIKQFFDIIEVKGGEKISILGYTIEAIKVEHCVSISMGYVITDKDGKKVGFSGDTTMCEGLINIIEKCDTIFIECSSTKAIPTHLSLEENLALKEKYKDKTLYSIHTSDEIYDNYQDKLNMPACGETIEI